MSQISIILSVIIFICAQSIFASKGDCSEPIVIYYDASEDPITFAAKDLKRILGKIGRSADLKELSDLSSSAFSDEVYVVISEAVPATIEMLAKAKGHGISKMEPQAYALRVTSGGDGHGYWALGGDRIGAMYGGIHLGELAAAGQLDSMADEDQKPYISQRGLKCNIPLDDRSPSFDDGGAAARTNIDDIYDLSFWSEYFDVMARQRYNALSLWNRHPFPSLVKVEGFEEISLQGVLDKDSKLVNDWSIERKVEHWNEVLELAYQRGIEVWPVVWNVELQAADGKLGITREKGNQPAKDYLRKATKQLFVSYPRLAGLGITAGEKMDDYTDSEKEQWVWDTYGMGVMDAKELFPDRKIRFVHRHWLTDWGEIESRFKQLPDGFELALKYAQARLYSATNPSWATRQLSEIPSDMATWWNLRNDDIYVQRWGDPEYVREYILNFPHESKSCDQPPCLTAGYIMGSDRYFWARESMSLRPEEPRQLETEKHWYKFLLWGRLGYDPYTPRDLLAGLIQYRFPSVDAVKVYDSWEAASRVIPMVNRFHYWNWDYFWWVEQGTGNEWSDIDGYHNINHIIVNKTQRVSGYINIQDFVAGERDGTSPNQVADLLESNSLVALRGIEGMSGGDNVELAETLGDIRSQSHFGLYWSEIIRGGVELERFRMSKDLQRKKRSIRHLEKALAHWKNYASQLSESYEKVVIAGHHLFDWDAITEDVARNIEIAKEAE